MDSMQTLRGILERAGRPEGADAVANGDPSEEEGYVALARGRVSSKPQLALIFRMANGSLRAFTYSHLFSVESDDPDLGFAINFARTKVVVRGRNLRELLRMVCLQRAAEIVEAGRTDAISQAADAPVVDSIKVVSGGG